MGDQTLKGDAVEDRAYSLNARLRAPMGWQGKFITAVAFLWAIFQLYIASTLPFTLTDVLGVNVIVNTDQARFIHLSFAMFLAAMTFPLFKAGPRDYIPWYDWGIGLLGVSACLYLIVFKDSIAIRAGLPTVADLVAATIGMSVLAVSVMRSLGFPLVVVAGVFVVYVFIGHVDWLPDAIRWKGASYSKAMWHYWMQTEGVFGVAIGISASMIFLFVLFGSILEKAGAGNYFIKIAFALLGHFRGGPAKAAVVASALSGIYSGSSIANTVTTGTFTIPLMKRTGFTAEKAGAVEVASSTNGQLTPPVMGAAAFLIAEFTGTSYTDIIKHALLPAVASYIGLIYIVHLEASKLKLKGLTKPPSSLTFVTKLIGFLGGFIGLSVIGIAVFFGLGWIKAIAPNAAFSVVVSLCCVIYLALLWLASRHPDLEQDPEHAAILELPRPGPTAITGLYFLLPIVILVWCIMLERLSPALSAFWATVAMSIIALTQRPLKAMFRGESVSFCVFTRGASEWFDGMIAGSRNMIGIGVATGAAGVIVGTISLTGAHQVVGEFVEFLSAGSLIAMLLLVALMSLILGMGLPTTANYIVVSSLMAPVIVLLGAKSGLIVPLVAVHLFVFYFGILADDTPPVGLAAFAASAISQGDPIKTGIQGFAYDIRTAILPFIFIFNTELLLIDVTLGKAILVFVTTVGAMMLFAAATQRFLLTRLRFWEIAVLLIVAFTLVRPGYWLDRLEPAFKSEPGIQILERAGSLPVDADLRIVITGPDFNDLEVTTSTSLIVPLGEAGEGSSRLAKHGLLIFLEGDQAIVDEPLPGSSFTHLASTLDFYADEPVVVSTIDTPNQRMAKEVFYLPAILLFAMVMFAQHRRLKSDPLRG